MNFQELNMYVSAFTTKADVCIRKLKKLRQVQMYPSLTSGKATWRYIFEIIAVVVQDSHV